MSGGNFLIIKGVSVYEVAGAGTVIYLCNSLCQAWHNLRPSGYMRPVKNFGNNINFLKIVII